MRASFSAVLLCAIIFLFADAAGIADNGKCVMLHGGITPEDDTVVESKNSDFRGHSWGCSEKQIRETESAEYIPEASKAGMRFYRTWIYGLYAYIAYLFTADKLYKGKYIFVGNSTDYEDYITSYYRIQSGLVSEYGEPYKSDEQFNGAFYSSWKAPGSVITLGLRGDSLEISLTLEYVNNTLL